MSGARAWREGDERPERSCVRAAGESMYNRTNKEELVYYNMGNQCILAQWVAGGMERTAKVTWEIICTIIGRAREPALYIIIRNIRERWTGELVENVTEREGCRIGQHDRGWTHGARRKVTLVRTKSHG